MSFMGAEGTLLDGAWSCRDLVSVVGGMISNILALRTTYSESTGPRAADIFLTSRVRRMF